MMPDCWAAAGGWGHTWGAPWGSGGGASPGGALPVADSYDIYCVCGEATAFIQSYDGVLTDPPSAFSIDVDGRLVVESSDGTDAALFLESPVPPNYTLAFLASFESLPQGLSGTEGHIFLGVTNAQGACAGLFFSKNGIGYAGAWNGSVQAIPDSQGLVSEGEPYLVRIAVNTSVEAAFIYITKADEAAVTGEKLRFILPLIPYEALPPGTAEGTHMRVRGTASSPTKVTLDSICLATGARIPNLPPVAVAGADQATRLCQIVQLDGSASYDPEGQPLLYRWRLIDAPATSMFSFEAIDGASYPAPSATGWSNKLYSSAFAPEGIPVEVGDVLLLDAAPYTIISVGEDAQGAYVQIDGFRIPDDLAGASFKILKQHGVNNAYEAKATFLPDVPGFYKFDLTVYDGGLFSEPSVTVVNALESYLPRGCTPDLSFLWNYLSDFWGLVEDRERIEVVWGGVAQAVATELYSLWQTEYSKSLRDIQRTFTRRWLHYDLFLREPYPDLTKARHVFRGVDSVLLEEYGAALSFSLVLSVPFFSDLVQVAVELPAGRSPQTWARLLEEALHRTDKRFKVTEVPAGNGKFFLRLTAPFPFTITAGTTGGFSVGAVNQPLVQAAGGGLLTPTSYKAPFSLRGIDLQENDLLYVQCIPASKGYCLARVAGVVDSPDDDHRFQRIILKEPLPSHVGSQWGVASRISSTQLDFYGGLCSFGDVALFEVTDNETGDTAYLTSLVLGASEGDTQSLAVGTDAVLLPYLARTDRFSTRFWGVYRRTYLPIDDLIVDIPILQRTIKSPKASEILRRNVDFFLETFRGKNCLRFDQRIYPQGSFVPLVRLWAEYTYLDNRPTIESNFGLAVDLPLEYFESLGTSSDYLSAVRGLWYAYLNGPTLHNLRVGTQILLGLPFAEEAGIIEEIRTDFSPTQGRILVRDKQQAEIVRTYTFPRALPLELNPATGRPYAVGDEVAQFAPLVQGAEVVDWVKDPTFFEGYLNQGFFYEIEKFHRFVVRVDSAAFTIPSLLFVRSFIQRIKPTYTHPLFVVRASMESTEIDVEDSVGMRGTLSLYDGAGFKQPYKSLLSTTDTSHGVATMFDQPDASPGLHPVAGDTPPTPPTHGSGHWKGVFDTTSQGGDAGAAIWAFDYGNRSPEMFVTGAARDTRYATGSAMPTFDGVLRFDRPVWAGQDPYSFGQSFLLHVPPAPDGSVLLDVLESAPRAMTVNMVELQARGRPSKDTAFVLLVFVNDQLVFEKGFVHERKDVGVCWFDEEDPAKPYTGAPFFLCEPMDSFEIEEGDRVVVVLRPQGDQFARPYFNAIAVHLGEAVPWTFDTPLPQSPQYSLVKLL